MIRGGNLPHNMAPNTRCWFLAVFYANEHDFWRLGVLRGGDLTEKMLAQISRFSVRAAGRF